MDIIDEYIKSKNVQALMNFLNHQNNNEISSFVFYKNMQESPDLF